MKLAAAIAAVCLCLPPQQQAEACGIKLSAGAPKLTRHKRSSNPSRILLIGKKDSALLARLRQAKHKVAFASSVKDAQSQRYNLVIVEANQAEEARARFTNAEVMQTKSSHSVTAKFAERILARRVTQTKTRGVVAIKTKRKPVRTGSEGIKPLRTPLENGSTAASLKSTPTPATRVAATKEVTPSPVRAEVSTPVAPKSVTPSPKVTKEVTPKEATPKLSSPTKARWARNFSFGTNSTALRGRSLKQLKRNVAWLKQNPSATVTIEGHTDTVGDEAYNLDLSERRANAAVDALVGMGIDRSRLSIVAKGETEPAFEPTTSGRNRRVIMLKD